VNRARVESLLKTETEWRPRIVDLVGDLAVDFLILRAQQLLVRNVYEDE
jgi:hypothetical protein